MKSGSRHWALFFSSVLLLLPSLAWSTYKVWCNGSPTKATVISSVFGETRDVNQIIPTRFHLGADIANSPCNFPTNEVWPIEDGIVKLPPFPGCVSHCLRVVSTDKKHGFDYVDIDKDPDIDDGDPVTAGVTVLARIQNISGPHLHLNEVQFGPAGNFKINPQRPNALDFSDSNATPIYISTNIGGQYGEMIIVPGSPALEGGAITPLPFVFRNDTYFVHGAVDILVTANAGSSRKGLYQAGAYIFTPGYLFGGKGNITFNSLLDADPSAADVQNVYLWQNPGSNTYFATNFKINGNSALETRIQAWNTDAEREGEAVLCGYIKNYPQGQGVSYCPAVYIDRTPPAAPTFSAGGSQFTSATSTTIVTITGADAGSGVYTITLSSPGWSQTSTNSVVSMTYSDTFPLGGGSLLDGPFTVQVCDLAQNCNSSAFVISTASGSASAGTGGGGTNVGVIPSTACPIVVTNFAAGTASASIAGPGFSSTQTFSCAPANVSTSAVAGAACNLSTGTYTATGQGCAGQTVQSTFSVTSASLGMHVCMTVGGTTQCGSEASLTESDIYTRPLYLYLCYTLSNNPPTCAACDFSLIGNPTSYCCGDCGWGGFKCCAIGQGGYAFSDTSVGFTNASSTGTAGPNWVATARVKPEGTVINSDASISGVTVDPGGGGTATAFVSQIGQGYPVASANGVMNIRSRFVQVALTVSTPTAASNAASSRRGLRPSTTTQYVLHGSEVSYFSASRASFTYTDSVNTDTTTAAIYSYDGTSWSSASITNQTVSMDTTTSQIVAAGDIFGGGTYAVLFAFSDSSAPATTLGFTASTAGFSGAVLVSTWSYAVLTATDVPVNGYAAGLATTYYRLDAASSTVSFSVYSSSIPLSLGFHVLESRSVDWAGNLETVNTSTFLVTAGTLFTGSSDLKVNGNGLLGFLSYANQMDIQSRAENNYTLLVSSVNRSPMLGVTNVGQIGIGSWSPQANLDAIPANPSDAALALRAGNASTATPSVQIALGFNGDISMRHAIRSEHSTSAAGNAIDFLLWYPPAGSTTTLGNLEAAALQGLATGSGDVELEVSDGSTVGNGVIHRAAAYAPSSREFKSDISYLSARDQARAYADVIGLRHASFRYKTDPRRTTRQGLIYEDAPKSIQGQGDTVVFDERLVNVELALKEALEKIQHLENRLKELPRTP